MKRTLATTLLALLLPLLMCGGGSRSDSHSGLPVPDPAACPPGSAEKDGCPEGGPATHEFWVKDRRADAPEGVSAHYRLSAERIAVSGHFVLYRETGKNDIMPAADAGALLTRIEPAFENLKAVYGGGVCPSTQDTGRTVLLAYDIRDDYAATDPAYVSGFFAPRDLFADDFTAALYGHPELIETTGNLGDLETAETLKGRSNEIQIVYLDLHPFYDGAAFGGDTEKAKTLFVEAALHELSHLFTYYRRVLDGAVKKHTMWISEGLAEQSPGMLAGSAAGQAERLEQYCLPLVQQLVASSPSLLDMNSSGNPLAGYILTNLFFNYMRHRAGTAPGDLAIMEAFVTEPDESVYGVDRVLGEFSFWNGGQDFSGMFGDWVITNWLYAAGRDLESLLDESGAAVDLGDGTYPSRKYDLSYTGAGIGKKGEAGLAFRENSLPLSGEGMVELLPASFVYHEYVPSTNESYTPLNQGMDRGLKIVLVRLAGESGAHMSIHDYDATMSLFAGETYHFMIYNPNYGGERLSTGQLPWDARNLASWVGEGKSGWQRGPGARTGNADSWFYRTTGTALSLQSVHGGDGNYVYVADSINHGVSRWNAGTGAFAGRMGSKSLNCADDGSEDDGWHMTAGKPACNFCRRSLNAPQGIAVDSSGFIYVADRNNHRIVKRNRDGNFVAWLGSPNDDAWQTLSMEEPWDLPYSMDAKSFNSPFGVAIDESAGFLYVSCYGSSVVSRRNLATGRYEGFIGNGVDSWDTAATTLSGQRGSARNYFSYPRGIVAQGGYLYVADEGNHRVSRWTRAGFNGSTGADPAAAWIGGGDDGWHDGATPAGAAQERKRFNYPGDVTADGMWLYIADRRNQRIARWGIASGNFGGWIGGGTSQWETNLDGPTQEPVGNAYTYPAIFMLEPQGVAFAKSADLGTGHSYLFTSTVYNARLSRWNIDCVENNLGGGCTGE
ncbi:MAG: hypothetical protein EPN93_21090 [Spirochaetes bacterium]|nr:MAG: hypothetical protein EPN93_21090 [Spirochaetota bacterium]